jgi:hypothetical protein
MDAAGHARILLPDPSCIEASMHFHRPETGENIVMRSTQTCAPRALGHGVEGGTCSRAWYDRADALAGEAGLCGFVGVSGEQAS